MNGLILAGAGAALTISAIGMWPRMIARVEIEKRRWLLNLLVAAGALLGVSAFAAGAGMLGGILASISLLFGAVYFGMLAIAGQSQQAPVFALGSPMPAFSAPDHDGEPFDSTSLRGHPVLIKFFRGHW